jgi:hypothetical protein
MSRKEETTWCRDCCIFQENVVMRCGVCHGTNLIQPGVSWTATLKNLSEDQWAWIIIQTVISSIIFISNGKVRIQVAIINLGIIFAAYLAIKVWGE